MMSAINAIEVRITRDIIRRRERVRTPQFAEQVITAVSVVASLGMLALFFPGAFWLVVLAASVLCLGT